MSSLVISFKRAVSKILAPRTLPDDFVGYENLIAFMRKRALLKLEGDMIEIGAFMGGGTSKLARLARKYDRKVYVIDIFDLSYDNTEDINGTKMCDIYKALLKGRPMLEVYQEATRGFDNIITMKEDSMGVKFDKEQKFFFGFVDGCHQRAYVENDFYVIWPNLVSGGALGFHDYDELSEVTEAVDRLLNKHKNEISKVHKIAGSYDISSILLIKK